MSLAKKIQVQNMNKLKTGKKANYAYIYTYMLEQAQYFFLEEYTGNYYQQFL